MRAHWAGAVRQEILIQCLTLATYFGLIAWLIYVVTEPFVRKRWPEMLITLVQWLHGHWTSERAGRDVLVGCAGGVIISAMQWLWNPVASPGLEGQRWRETSLDQAAGILDQVAAGLFLSVGLMFVMSLIASVAGGRRWAAIAAAVGFACALLPAGEGISPLSQPLCATALILLIARYGVVSSTIASTLVICIHGGGFSFDRAGANGDVSWTLVAIFVILSLGSAALSCRSSWRGRLRILE
jgi:hypothetical protein